MLVISTDIQLIVLLASPDTMLLRAGRRSRSPRLVFAGQHEHRKLSRGAGLVIAKLRSLRDEVRP
jgi:hypothetical protein